MGDLLERKIELSELRGPRQIVYNVKIVAGHQFDPSFLSLVLSQQRRGMNDTERVICFSIGGSPNKKMPRRN
jgi:hypothetical protein